MKKQQIILKINDIRAVKKANIALEGITVIAGENGCGKSLISKLLYNLIKTTINFDSIIDSITKSELKRTLRPLDQITREISYLIEEDKEYYEFSKDVREKYRRFHFNYLDEFEDFNKIIDYLIEIFNFISKDENKFKKRTYRIKKILLNELNIKENDEDVNIITLLEDLKKFIKNTVEKGSELKEKRPINILYNSLDNAFYDNPLPKTFNINEYGIPIIDNKNKILKSLTSIHNVAYIDTPMILGLNNIRERGHWNELNSILTRRTNNVNNGEINNIFKKDIISGDINYNEDNLAFSNKQFVYKRADGSEFDLIECATGLKSFAILQLLYKNRFFDKNTFLIIDEPEAHLHPQWVVEYARLLVLLHKNIGVKFLIASHHPDMISAIKYISEKEEVSNNLNFYLAKKHENSFTYNYERLGTEIEQIFASFNIAFERIDLYGKKE
jgi:predicted ATPase